MKRGLDTFQTVKTEGAILPADLMRRLVDGDRDIPGLRPEDYHLAKAERLNEASTRAWNRLQGAWEGFKDAMDSLPESDVGTSLTRERWLLILFQELGYGRLTTHKAYEIEGKTYPVSHEWQNTPIHLVSFRQELDKRTPGRAGAARVSPHSLVQEFLNRSDDHLWGFVSNGLNLRLLRDNVSLTRQAYVEFDLQAMMDSEAYSDFFLLYLLCHQSRVEVPEGKTPEHCWLEKWYNTAAQQGVRALDQLRDGVQKAIEALGGGFLAYPGNTELREKLRSGALGTQDYYRQLLRQVYRLLFLFVAEDRELLSDPSSPPGARKLYLDHYSTQRLRSLAGKTRGTRHPDLWRALRLVLEKLHHGCPQLALPALGSYLFSAEATTDLNDQDIANKDLLKAVRALAFTLDRNVLRPVNYRNLGPEELGSVYESLLEMHPTIHIEATKPEDRFRLTVAAGSERKTTGSYYTPTSLVNCLLDSALDPVLDEACKKPDPEKAVLALKVCDPACGSGHFLIAAAHRIAKRLAAIRSGEDEPAPEHYQHALRDVIGHCIYGVDINPMSVELCKVSLWMEAMEPGKPLAFLDHHIKCGNSLLGTTPALLKKGIPDDAFKPIEGDDKEYCKELKKQNKSERKDIEQGQQTLFYPWERLGDLAAAMVNLDEMPDDTPEALRKKQERYDELVKSSGYLFGQLWADAWCAAFVWKKVRERDGGLPYAITERDFRAIEKSPHSVPRWMKDEIRRVASEYQFFHWHLEFPDVFRVPKSDEKPENEQTGWSGGFDCVLGNPPWGADIPARSKMLLRYCYSGSQRGTIDTFALFTELFALVACSEGLFGLVLPDILLLKNYPGIRLFLLERTAMVEIAHWGQAFGQVNIDVCSLVARRTTPSNNHRVRCIPAVIDQLPRASKVNEIPQVTFRTTKQYRFNLLLSHKLQSLLDVAKSLGPPIKELFILREGVHSGNVRAKLFVDYPEGNSCQPLIFGRNEISPMVLTWAGRYIQLDPNTFDREAGDYFNLGDPELHRSPKLLVRRTGDYVLAAVDNDGVFCSNNFFLCVPKPSIGWEQVLYVCAVLNSRFATWFFRTIQPRTGKLFAELKITHLEDIPVPFVNDDWAKTVGQSIKGWLAEPASITGALSSFNQALESRIAVKDGELAALLRRAQ